MCLKKRWVWMMGLCACLLSANVLAESVYYRGNGNEPETLDVHKSTGVPEAEIQRDLFEGLTTSDAKGQFQAGAAEKWDVSPDGKTYTFYLRKDGKWSNGEPVTAHDFLFAFQRLLNPATASEYAMMLWPVVGAEAYSKGESKDPNTLGIKVMDDYTLQLTLSTPAPYFLEMLSHHSTYPVSKKVLEKEGDQWTHAGKLVGNGPYMLQEWQPQAHIKIVKNPHYRRTKDIKIDSVYYLPTEDLNAELKRYRAGELQSTYMVPESEIKWVKENLAQDFRNVPYFGTYYYALNLRKEPFKDQVKLRRALALAIDRDILTQKVTNTGRLSAYGWVPPGASHYTQQAIPEASMTQGEREALAQKLYAESGYSADKPLAIELLYNTNEDHKKLAIAVAAMWKKVLGVDTTLRNEEWKVYLASRKAGNFAVLRAGWIGDYNDAYNFLSILKSDIGELNMAAYNSPAYDELLHASEKEADTAKRAELMQKAEQVLLADMPIIPIYFYNSSHLVSPKLKGWEDNVMDIHPTQYLSLEP